MTVSFHHHFREGDLVVCMVMEEIHKMGLKEDPQNFLLMHTVGVNVSGQIASVIAGGLIMSLVYTIG